MNTQNDSKSIPNSSKGVHLIARMNLTTWKNAQHHSGILEDRGLLKGKKYVWVTLLFYNGRKVYPTNCFDVHNSKIDYCILLISRHAFIFSALTFSKMGGIE